MVQGVLIIQHLTVTGSVSGLDRRRSQGRMAGADRGYRGFVRRISQCVISVHGGGRALYRALCAV